MPAAIRGGHCALRRRPGPPVEHQRARPVPRAGVRVHAALGVSAGSPLLFWKALCLIHAAACFRSEQDESAQNAGGDFGFGDGADFNGEFNDLGNDSIQIGAHGLDSRQLSLSALQQLRLCRRFRQARRGAKMIRTASTPLRARLSRRSLASTRRRTRARAHRRPTPKARPA